MGESSQSLNMKDVVARNVSLHSRGKKEQGTLYLRRHHLIFTYTPDTPASTPRSSTAGSRSLSGAHSAESARASSSIDGSSHGEPNPRQAATKIPRKEIWVPYPMINHCMLRPSHSQGFRTYDHDTSSEAPELGADDTAFPPVYGTNAYTRPSTDSARLAPYASPQRSASPGPATAAPIIVNDGGRVPALRIRKRDFQMMAFHFHSSTSEKSSDDLAREVFYCLRSRCCVDSIQSMHSFHFIPPQEEHAVQTVDYDARREFARMGIGGKAAEGPGSAWRISEINHDYTYSPTYPNVLCVPRAVSDNMLKYGGVFRSKARIPALTYLHSNGGSITRSSQPMVGIGSKRNPQDERLVSAIFSSHTPLKDSPPQLPVLDGAAPSDAEPSSAEADKDLPELSLSQSNTVLDEKFAEQETGPQKKIYGSTRRNLIVDARPKVNALANRATGGGIEDVANYVGLSGTIVERFFLNIANIHAMRKSLDKVIESFANSDYLDMKPNQELLRNSGWLPHIANLLDGAEMVTRVVGLGGSHVLVHCSDGWDRTAQVAALAELMLDPYYRTFSGFITLVQKDFLSFGHKFNHRHGIQGSEKWFEIENERVMPSRTKDPQGGEATSFNKAFSGAKNWFEKNRNNIFKQQGESKSALDGPGSRPPSPPMPNSLLHSPATTSTKEDSQHRTDTKEIAPIFHQFLDAVFQLQYHYPNAFEFNERFLRRLFYQAHSGTYGEFLFNTERDRTEQAGKFASAWPHFLSRRREFINPDYVAKENDPLLFPKRQAFDREIEVRWWSSLFARKDEEMNTPRALAPPDPEPKHDAPRLSADPSTISLETTGSATPEKSEESNTVKQARSMPSFAAVRDGLNSTFASFQIRGSEDSAPPIPQSSTTTRPALEQRDTDVDVLAKYANSSQTQTETAASSSSQQVWNGEDDESDPLGALSGGKVQEAAGSSSRLDVAAFAKQSAFSER